MSLEDPSIIIDLRINTGFQGSNSIYFGMNLMNILMRYCSYIRELLDRVIARLNTKYQGPLCLMMMQFHQKNG
ncbi:hypothetical protein RhiirC2_743667 [Rhizophagus irregularis]|uniref:Uncharacterized protein n=1 Tax=Rhizophagus irregularis TaxID=588596 RepID=A0A2N1NDK2_9GLOM|nr:hypothetical protein RhiirC2_743667 [Rhizophagus irregularis]